MRFVRHAAVLVTVVLLLSLATAAVAAARPSATRTSSGGTTYTVWVGAENAHRAVGIMAYFPSDIRIHVGDTVRWLQNSNEIHTVTFLGGQSLPDLLVPATPPPSPLMVNPDAVARTEAPVTLNDPTNGTANSGIMGRETGQYRWFKVTFTAAGTYEYVCLVHGTMMSGTVQVVADNVRVPSPMQDKATARQQIARQMAKVPAVFKAARKAELPPTPNGDGTWNHYVSVGYAQGQIDLMRFFPRQTLARPGDTVTWTLGATNEAPHTITFLNGTADQPLFIPVGTPPDLYVNPAVLFPSPLPPTPLTRTGYFNSGILQPGTPMTSYSVTVGDITPGPLPYLCLLHDTSGMTGRLVILP
jgi:plastocyanin